MSNYKRRNTTFERPPQPKVIVLSEGQGAAIARRCHGRDFTPLQPHEWDQLAFEIANAHPTLASFENLRESTHKHSLDGIVPISLVNMPYRTAEKDSATQPLVAACGRLPYRSDLLRPLPRRHSGLDVTFTLNADDYIGIGELPSVKIDFADGRGWQHVRWDSPVPVRYSSAGNHLVRVRASDARGNVARAGFHFTNVEIMYTADYNWRLSRTFDNVTYKGTAYIYLNTGNTDKKLGDAVIFAQPFIDITSDEYYGLLNSKGALDAIRSGTNTVNNPPTKSVILIIFDDRKARIEGNAAVVQDCIQQLLANTDTSTTHHYGGVSMGAVIMRYALCAWEQQQTEPNARAATYFSIDGPHCGASIPVSIQAQLLFWNIVQPSADLTAIVEELHSPASKQLLLYNLAVYHAITAPYSFTVMTPPEFTAFWDSLWKLGGYPSHPRKVAVANGAGDGSRMLPSGTGNVAVIGYIKYLKGYVEAATAFAETDPESGAGTTVAEALALKPSSILIQSAHALHGFSNAPGGYKDSFELLKQKLVDGFENVDQIGTVVDALTWPNHTFVPTVSALDMYEVTDPSMPLNGAKSHFDDFWWSPGNTEHASMHTVMQNWLLKNLLDIEMKDSDDKEWFWSSQEIDTTIYAFRGLSIALFSDRIFVLHIPLGPPLSGRLYWSTFDGHQTWTGEQNLGAGITTPPCAVVVGNRLLVTHTGEDGDGRLWYMTYTDQDGWSPTDKLFPSDENPFIITGSPSMAMFGKRLFLAFQQSDDMARISYAYSEDGGVTWEGGAPLGDDAYTTDSPTLVAFNEKLYCFFGSSDGQGTLMYTVSTDGISWATSQPVPNQTLGITGRPAAVEYNNRLILVRDVAGNDGYCVFCEFDGSEWSADSYLEGNNGKYGITGSPALMVFGDRLILMGQGRGDAGLLWYAVGRLA